MSRVYGSIVVVAAAAMIAFAAVGPTDCLATTNDWVSDELHWWDVPQPRLETEPGHNLYWHDPTLGWRENCRYWSPSALGCPPVWYSKVEALFLKRDPAYDYPFASTGAGGPQALGSTHFDDEFETGARILIGRSVGEWYRWEVSYMGPPQWSDETAVRNIDANDGGGLGDLFSPFSDFGIPTALPGLDYANFASIGFASKLQGGEFNVRKRILMHPGRYESSVLVGMRLLEIDERFRYLATSTTGAGFQNQLEVETDNEMIGAQAGYTAQFLVRPRVWIDFDLRGGIYNNNASQATRYSFSNPAYGSGAVAEEKNRTTFVGDMWLQLNYNFAPAVTAYAGYYAMWVSGAALAANNVETDINLLTLGPPTLDHRADLVYHGPLIGLVFAR